MNIQDIRNLEPCYDPTNYLPEDWEGTALDILKVEACPAEDRLWVVCHEGWIDDKTLRLWAVWCAREALKLVDNPDPRSIAACDVAERFANGDATREELAAARAAEWDARDAAWAAAWAAARAAAWDARDAARDAAWAAAWAAARAAAWDARDAARDAAWAAAWAAEWDAARDAARDAQVKRLVEMLEGQG